MSYVGPTGVNVAGAQGQLVTNQNFLPGLPSAGSILKTVGGAVIRQVFSTATAGANNIVGSTFPEGANIEIVPGLKKNRRRRRKLLTCGDKADIAFLYGQLGGGALGRSAISSLLSRRCS